MTSKMMGGVGVLAVAKQLTSKGWLVSAPMIDSGHYDLIADTGSRLYRIQVKYVEKLKDGILIVKNRTHSVYAGKISKTVNYTEQDIEVLAVYCAELDKCFYIPIERAAGRGVIWLRVDSPIKEKANINYAKDFEEFPDFGK